MIELPDKFEKDVQGKDTYLVPLIIIDDRIYLSTGKVVLENNYDPLIQNIGTIQESIDIKSKKFKVLGPAEAPISKIKNLWRMNSLIMAKKKNPFQIQEYFINEIGTEFLEKAYNDVKIKLDIDPINMLIF